MDVAFTSPFAQNLRRESLANSIRRLSCAGEANKLAPARNHSTPKRPHIPDDLLTRSVKPKLPPDPEYAPAIAKDDNNEGDDLVFTEEAVTEQLKSAPSSVEPAKPVPQTQKLLALV